jgi:hypothetical protein
MLIHVLNERSFISHRSASIAFLYAKLAQAKNTCLRSRAKIRLGIGKESRVLPLSND